VCSYFYLVVVSLSLSLSSLLSPPHQKKRERKKRKRKVLLPRELSSVGPPFDLVDIKSYAKRRREGPTTATTATTATTTATNELTERTTNDNKIGSLFFWSWDLKEGRGERIHPVG